MTNTLFTASTYAVDSADALASKAAAYGTATAEFSEGGALFKLCMLALSGGAAKVAFEGDKLYTVYATANNASPLTKKPIDLKAKNALANKKSLLNSYRDIGTKHGEKAFSIVETIVGKLNSKGAKGMNTDKIRSAFAHVDAKGAVDLGKVAPIVPGKKSAKKAAAAETVNDAVANAIALLTDYAKRFKKEGAFAGALKVLQTVAPRYAKAKPVAKAKTATAPRKVSAKS
jgi:hypothetical protein